MKRLYDVPRETEDVRHYLRSHRVEHQATVGKTSVDCMLQGAA